STVRSTAMSDPQLGRRSEPIKVSMGSSRRVRLRPKRSTHLRFQALREPIASTGHRKYMHRYLFTIFASFALSACGQDTPEDAPPRAHAASEPVTATSASLSVKDLV